MNDDNDYGKLEPEFREPFSMYQLEPTPKNATSLLNVLRPTVDKGIRAHVGRQVSPTTRSHAKKITLQAVRSYDPRQSKLSTHVINHLKGLRRVTRQQQQVLKVPERVVLDQRYLHSMSEEFEDKWGREPTTYELADYAKIPVKRIEYVRQYHAPLSGGQVQAQTDAGGEVSGASPAVQSPAAHQAWIEAVYSDMNPTNQLIMEMTLGLHGKKRRSNQEIAARLKLSPGAISQRKWLIQRAIDREAELSPF